MDSAYASEQVLRERKVKTSFDALAHYAETPDIEWMTEANEILTSPYSFLQRMFWDD